MLGRHTLGALCLLAFTLSAATAQVGIGPRQSPAAPPIEPPRDRPFPGAITLAVNATDVAHRIYAVHETIPVRGGHALTLLYPQWETGSHAATASAAALAGLRIQAGGHVLAWRRDPVDVFAFHVDVPRGVASVDVDFQFLSPVSARSGALTMTRDLVTVPWPSVFVYPAGWYARDIPVDASVRLPAGLHAATALELLQADEEPDSGEL
jgi:predicted metalloprotease with PDZ domain